MAQEYYIGQIFEEMYPPEASIWADENNAVIDEIEPLNDKRRFVINEVPEPTEEETRTMLDGLTLTPADVERALYKAKGMDFEDLKALIAQQIPSIDIKGLAIEFRAKDFYRGAEAGGMRLFDVVGALLGYSPEQMDYLFIHKELPKKGKTNYERRAD